MEFIIRHPEERFAQRHTRVTRRLELAGAMEMEEELPDGDADGVLHGDQLLMAERLAAVRPGGAIRTNEVIEGIIARDNFKPPVSLPTQMPAPPTQQRAGPSRLIAHLPPFRRLVNTSDENLYQNLCAKMTSIVSKKIWIEQAELDRLQQRQLCEHSPELKAIVRLLNNMKDITANMKHTAEEGLNSIPGLQI